MPGLDLRSSFSPQVSSVLCIPPAAGSPAPRGPGPGHSRPGGDSPKEHFRLLPVFLSEFSGLTQGAFNTCSAPMVWFTPRYSHLPRRQVTLGPLQGHSCHCLRLWGPQDTTRAMMYSLMALALPLGLSDTRLSKRQPQQRIWEQRTLWLPPTALAPCAQPSHPAGSRSKQDWKAFLDSAPSPFTDTVSLRPVLLAAPVLAPWAPTGRTGLSGHLGPLCNCWISPSWI